MSNNDELAASQYDDATSIAQSIDPERLLEQVRQEIDRFQDIERNNPTPTPVEILASLTATGLKPGVNFYHGGIENNQQPLEPPDRFYALKEYLCPVLQSASNDAWDIAKAATPALLALMVAGKIPFNPDPWLHSMISITISRMGIASFCASYNTGSVETNVGKQASKQTKGSSRRAKKRR